MIKRIAIFGSDNRSVTSECVTKIIRILLDRGLEVAIYNKLLPKINHEYKEQVIHYENILEERKKPDLVLSVGGDGTFLETLVQVKDSGIPVAGVNTGRLGFLANIHDDIEISIDKLLDNKFTILERCLLLLAEPEKVLGEDNVALNDITIQKADLNMIRIRVLVDGLYLNTYWADGLIISTATGSTAYNLSTGGPILAPQDGSIIISPLSPHNLTVRPIILPGTSALRFVVEGRSNEYLATCDYRSVKLPFSRELQIKQADYKLRTINVEGHDFFSTLRDKLMWGADPRN